MIENIIYLKHQSLKRTYLIPNTLLKNRSKLPPKNIKAPCKWLADFSQVLQVMTLCLTGYFLQSVLLNNLTCLLDINYNSHSKKNIMEYLVLPCGKNYLI